MMIRFTLDDNFAYRINEKYVFQVDYGEIYLIVQTSKSIRIKISSKNYEFEDLLNKELIKLNKSYALHIIVVYLRKMFLFNHE